MTRQELLEFRTKRGIYTRGQETRFTRELKKREIRVPVTNEDILRRLDQRR